MKTKKDKNYSFNHTKERIQERYNGIEISREFYDNMCKKIIDKDSSCEVINIETQKNDTQTIIDIEFFMETIRVVWSEKRQCITTALKIHDDERF